MTIPKIELPLKPTYLKFAEDLDFYHVFQQVEQQTQTCFILESLGEDSYQSRYSIIGFDPETNVSAKGNDFTYNNKTFVVDNPYKVLQQIVPQNAIARSYAGGLVGYIGYDAINYFEPSVQVKSHKLFEQFSFGIYTDGIVHDKVTNEFFYFFYQNNRLAEVKRMLQKSLKKREVIVRHTKDTLTQKEHANAVEHIKEHIRKGDTFQCQIGLKMEYTVHGEAINIYTKLREVNPSPYMYFMKMRDVKIIGASPELLFRLRSGEMETFPLAGTIRRGKTPVEDRQLARLLLNDPKEIAEHNMLVDLHRNDLGRVAEFGTVKVRSLMDIKKFSHVQHISSEIAGIIKQDQDMFTALASNFPAGTLSGAPKIESMKLIDRFEPDARGPYGGAIGHFGFNGDCTFAIPIRTMFIKGEYGFIQASGGIVYDSLAENEYDEIQRKLGALKKVLNSL